MEVVVNYLQAWKARGRPEPNLYWMPKTVRPFKSISVALAIVVCLLVTGCTNATLDLVNGVTAKFTNSLTSFKGLPDDLYNTCIRLAAWDYQNVSTQMPAEIQPGPSVPGPSPTPPHAFQDLPPIVEAGLLAGQCKSVQAGSKEWATANQIVINYVSALGDLAGGSKPSSYGFKDLATNVKDAWFVHMSANDKVTPDQIGDAGSVLDQAVAAAFATQRATAIQMFARQAHDPIQRILTVLDLAADVYNSFLRTERAYVDGVFAITVVNTNKNLSPSDAQTWVEALTQIGMSEMALHQYVDLLNAVSCAQAQLVETPVPADAAKKCAPKL